MTNCFCIRKCPETDIWHTEKHIQWWPQSQCVHVNMAHNAKRDKQQQGDFDRIEAPNGFFIRTLKDGVVLGLHSVIFFPIVPLTLSLTVCARVIRADILFVFFYNVSNRFVKSTLCFL